MASNAKALELTTAVISGSTEVKPGSFTALIAGTTILIAVMSNNMVKGTLAYRFGEKMFGRKVLFTFVASMIAGLIAIFAPSVFSMFA